MNLQLTYDELKEITYGDISRFEVIYNDIPKEGHSNDYIEDDGRCHNECIFKDTETDIIYNFNYTWYPNHDHEFPLCFLQEPVGIEFVDISVLNPPKEIPAPIIILTPEQIADKQLMDRYDEIKSMVTPMDKDKAKVIPVGVVDEIMDFLKTQKFGIFELRAAIIPVCIEYKIEHKSFWTYIQKRRGAWL